MKLPEFNYLNMGMFLLQYLLHYIDKSRKITQDQLPTKFHPTLINFSFLAVAPICDKGGDWGEKKEFYKTMCLNWNQYNTCLVQQIVKMALSYLPLHFDDKSRHSVCVHVAAANPQAHQWTSQNVHYVLCPWDATIASLGLSGENEDGKNTLKIKVLSRCLIVQKKTEHKVVHPLK